MSHVETASASLNMDELKNVVRVINFRAIKRCRIECS
ncbi:hypothetical protein B0F88_10788 [Methylobacter tundripaludum]|uniref:Uncharacterized protein n=1 Tax=Methylobacter tundripaludum TaxID=173365 RepID=A0A2S6H290_9GAMM|nr:hypothetical protein B0F88_10788 [Methylobacter tundripaludum]